MTSHPLRFAAGPPLPRRRLGAGGFARPEAFQRIAFLPGISLALPCPSGLEAQ
jgi:hypothetical protein